jgi:hypothetical protein
MKATRRHCERSEAIHLLAGECCERWIASRRTNARIHMTIAMRREVCGGSLSGAPGIKL